MEQLRLSKIQKQFNELFAKVKYLEDLSKEYDEENYQLITAMYIRSAQYPDSEWKDVLGDFDEDFIAYVEINEGDKNVSSLRDLGYNYTFKNPDTKQEIDFYKLFANLNVILLQDKGKFDAASWGEYICQNAIKVKDKNYLQPKDEIKLNMQTKDTYGDYIRFADYDCVSIYKILIKDPFVYDSLYLSIVTYYATFDKDTQINNFIDFLNFDRESDNLVEDVYLRLKKNYYLQTICTNAGLPFNSTNEDVFKTTIEAYVELLGLPTIITE